MGPYISKGISEGKRKLGQSLFWIKKVVISVCRATVSLIDLVFCNYASEDILSLTTQYQWYHEGAYDGRQVNLLPLVLLI